MRKNRKTESSWGGSQRIVDDSCSDLKSVMRLAVTYLFPDLELFIDILALQIQMGKIDSSVKEASDLEVQS